jgi:hypothetical protein
MAGAVPSHIATPVADAARDTLGGAASVAAQLPAGVLDTAHAAFASGLQLVAGVAAVAAGALAIAPTLGDRPTASAAAVELLESAAEQAAQQPAWDPRPDQLVYTRALEVAYSMAELDGEGVESLVTQTREAWRSVDGLHPGLIKGVVKPGTDPLNPEGGPYEIPLEPCDGTWEGCGDIPAFPVGMPTDGDPDAMLAFLRKVTEPYDMGPGNKEHKPDQEVFDEAAALLRQGGLAPQMESAVLGAVARIPGVTTSGNVSDAAGRDGVGVGLTTAYGVRVDLVIDPESEEFLGVRELSPEGELTGAWALFEAGVVDVVGEMP